MADKKVLRLADSSESAFTWSPVDCLKDAINSIETGDIPCNRVLVIMLDDTEGNYNVRSAQSGLKSSQIISLLEIAKVRAMARMGHIPE